MVNYELWIMDYGLWIMDGYACGCYNFCIHYKISQIYNQSAECIAFSNISCLFSVSLLPTALAILFAMVFSTI